MKFKSLFLLSILISISGCNEAISSQTYLDKNNAIEKFKSGKKLICRDMEDKYDFVVSTSTISLTMTVAGKFIATKLYSYGSNSDVTQFDKCYEVN